MSQVGQQAVIIHRSGYQTMALGMNYRAEGALNGLVWVVPVPSMPDEISTASTSLFKDMDRWVDPRWDPDTSSRGSASSQRALTIRTAASAGAYTVHAMEGRGAEGAGALNSWLLARGYGTVGEGQLDYYVARSWTFLAVELERASGLSTSASFDPLVLGFASPTAVLPLKLSSNAGRFPVRIYLVTDDPMDESVFGDAREKGFMVAGSQDYDFLSSAAARTGILSVEVETFAHGDAPRSLQSVLDLAGDWTQQESLELRLLTNPDIGHDLGWSIHWTEDLSIPGLPLFDPGASTPSESATSPTEPSSDAEETVEEDGFWGCTSSVSAPGQGMVGVCLTWMLLGMRRR
jgi:hypothetical protein